MSEKKIERSFEDLRTYELPILKVPKNFGEYNLEEVAETVVQEKVRLISEIKLCDNAQRVRRESQLNKLWAEVEEKIYETKDDCVTIIDDLLDLYDRFWLLKKIYKETKLMSSSKALEHIRDNFKMECQLDEVNIIRYKNFWNVKIEILYKIEKIFELIQLENLESIIK